MNIPHTKFDTKWCLIKNHVYMNKLHPFISWFPVDLYNSPCKIIYKDIADMLTGIFLRYGKLTRLCVTRLRLAVQVWQPCMMIQNMSHSKKLIIKTVRVLLFAWKNQEELDGRGM
jgi:hypothetical protein